MAQLQEKLISSVGSFGLNLEWMKDLFKVDNIGRGTSSAELAKTGGSQGIFDKLASSATTGIEDSAASKQKRIDYFGSNELVEPPAKTIWEMFIKCFDDLTLQMLLIAAIVSLIIGIATEGWDDGWYEAVAILVAIAIVVTLTTINDYSQQEQFKRLFRKSQNRIVKVLRGGKLQEIDAQELLVGDVYEVNTGLIVPADSLLIEKHGRSSTHFQPTF